MNSDYTKSPDQIFIDLVNNDNSTSFQVGELSLGTPVVRTDGSEEQAFNNRKTTLRVSAVDGTGYKEFVDMDYNRLHFRDIFTATEADTVQFPIVTSSYQLEDKVYVSDLLPQINSTFNLNLQAADFWDQPLPTFEGPPPYDPAYVRLEAKPGSLIYIGGVKLGITPNDYPLASALPVTALDGLVFDTHEVPDAYPRINSFVHQTLAAPGYW